MKRLAIAVLLSVFVAGTAVAADTGFYAGVNAGSTKIDYGAHESTTGFSLFGGYSFNENFGAEAAYINFGSKDYLLGAYSAKSSGFSLSGVGSYPFNDQFSVFAKLGFASTKLEESLLGLTASSTKSDVTWGVGAQFNINNQVGIRAGYDRYKLGNSVTVNQSLTSVGVVFKF